MIKEDKELLLKDLCARLPYGVKLDFYSEATDEHIACTLLGIEPEGDKPVIAKVDCGAFMFPQEHIKPFLRPMTSMTKKEKERICNIRPYLVDVNDIVIGVQCNTFEQITECQDWLNAHHFDYRGLIPMGLALEAPEGMYKTE